MHIFPMHIGGLVPRNAVFLAPMAGVTDLPMREMAMQLGAGLAVGEMQSADLSLSHTRKSRLRQRHTEAAGLRVTQIVGYDPIQLADAARFNVDRGADIIDINMGCPAKKVCRRAAGSALLADEGLVKQILETVVAAVDVPVTLKIRTGSDPAHRNGVTIARIAEQSGIQMLTVHGRTRADRFNGWAEYDTIARIVEHISIPVIANGDIDSLDKARHVLTHTGAAGVMIGRAAQGQLWFPGALARALWKQASVLTVPSPEKQLDIHRHHVTNLHAFHGEMMGVRIARKHTVWFIESWHNQNLICAERGAAFRKMFNLLSTPKAQLRALHALADLPHSDQQKLAA